MQTSFTQFYKCTFFPLLVDCDILCFSRRTLFSASARPHVTYCYTTKRNGPLVGTVFGIQLTNQKNFDRFIGDCMPVRRSIRASITVASEVQSILAYRWLHSDVCNADTLLIWREWCIEYEAIIIDSLLLRLMGESALVLYMSKRAG
jgi:hypothetical protein